MSGCRKLRGGKAARAWRALTGLLAAFVLAMALFDPVFEGPSPAATHEITSPVSTPLAAHEQGVQALLSQALACHMYFEHHQLVRAENTYIVPAQAAGRACYLTRVIPLDSLEPYPLRRPPRA